MMLDALRMSPLGGVASPASATNATAGNAAVDFAAQLADTIRAGESAVVSGIRGDIPLQQVVETVMQAERTLTMAVSIRDKIVSAYLEMTRMQI